MIEIWKDIPNYEGYYQASSFGRIKSLSRQVRHYSGSNRITNEKILTPAMSTNKYLKTILSKRGAKKSYFVHQLVAMAFLNHNPNGWGIVCNHKNFNRLDNRLENIELITVRKNTNQSHLPSTSKYTGVSYDKIRNKWKATIYINGKNKHLGRHPSEYDAHLAYEKQLLLLG